MCLERLILATSGPRIFLLLLCLCSILSTSLKTRLRLEIHFGVIINFPNGFIYLEGSIGYEGEFYLVFVWFCECLLFCAVTYFTALSPNFNASVCLLCGKHQWIHFSYHCGFIFQTAGQTWSERQTERALCRRDAKENRRLFEGMFTSLGR